MKKETPILYSTPMVIATADETKTETRRTKGLESFNLDPKEWAFKKMLVYPDGKLHACFIPNHPDSIHGIFSAACPFGQVGDLLWVRETVSINAHGFVSYKANYIDHKKGAWPNIKWTPSIHMPKKATRIWLEITDINVERLQSISKDSAKSEGILLLQKDSAGELYKDYYGRHLGIFDPRESFASLWKSIDGVESWDHNPWVWVIKFKKTTK